MSQDTTKATVILILTDSIDIRMDELGLPKAGDSEETLRATQELLSSLKDRFGPPDIVSADARRSGQGRTFGGLDVITQNSDIIFQVANTVALLGVVPLLKQYMKLKMRRRSVRIDVREGKTIKSIKLDDITENELKKIIDKLDKR